MTVSGIGELHRNDALDVAPVVHEHGDQFDLHGPLTDGEAIVDVVTSVAGICNTLDAGCSPA